MRPARSGPANRVVVVGGGLAGLSGAERLRERGFAGQIVVIGDEPHRPYNRTPLSKQLLTGHLPSADLRLHAHTDPAASWRLGTPAAGLDLDGRQVILTDGTTVAFDGLIIATGVTARRLPDQPTTGPVHTLRTLADAAALDETLTAARHVAVLGGGFLGCELAVTARHRALSVSLIEPTAALMTRPLGTQIGALAAAAHQRAGVRLHLDSQVTRWTPTADGYRLTLTGGTHVDADAVLVAVGTLPAVGWLEHSGVALGDGILCDATTHVLADDGRPVAGIVAAGDVAAWPNHRFDTIPRRVEHWINAVEMGQAAADALLAGPHHAAPFTPIPRFWSHQHDIRIQAAGMPALATDTTLLAGSYTDGRFLAGYTHPAADGTPILLGAVAFNAPRALTRWTPRIGQPLPHPAGRHRHRAPRPSQTLLPRPRVEPGNSPARRSTRPR
ncbi:FAD-dependent oxidoreductase [Frankia sp. AgB1.9]|uniref:NAD(P)/FAD-dependent oxidoreductase n=1 Tax=unclassified Frankia TaxID=2632575 RepID=UPI00193458CC|nr:MULTISPECIES: FAD-dependent oxidoreductase [unclassified Frankia]MBL7489946.1 FAD-dependent oxidoreductase [Frankia sp. AgW1.1]MBL7552677.1 FAD-dependent oxidoreductase [Frankia sp. AgB1.9]MBL7623842.1 FAD-dependent oxidoreductase [Frankia sp. AgB1.8]